MKVTVIGTGMVGRTFADRLDGLGHDVAVGTRNVANTMERTVETRTGLQPYSAWQHDHPRIRLAPFTEAGAHGQIIINATAGIATLSALTAVGSKELAGKVLIDVALPLDGAPGQPRSLVAGTNSLGEQIQQAFPDTHVVKTLNTVHVDVMVDPTRIPGRHHVFVSGDNMRAKAKTAELLRELGWKEDTIVDLGDIRTARGVEMYASLYFNLAGVLNTFDFNIALVRR